MTARFLVTGASGFIGAHLVSRLVSEGQPVRCLQHSKPLASYDGTYEKCQVDLMDFAGLRECLSGITTVIHLAAIGSAAIARQSPEEAFRVNTVGTQNILEAARIHQVRRVVLLSTAQIYGKPAHLPVTESHAPNPASIYSATKYAAEILGKGYSRSFGMDIVTLRPFNVYGPGQEAKTVIPDIVSQALQGRPVQVQDPRPARDFVYVRDVVDAIVLAARAPGIAGCEINLGSGRAVSIRSLVDLISSLVGQQASCRDNADKEEFSDDIVYGSYDQAFRLLKWEPTTVLQTGLAKTIAWWRAKLAEGTLKTESVQRTHP